MDLDAYRITLLFPGRLFPHIRRIVESRSITVKVGQVEPTVQELSEKVLATTADIQEKLASATVNPASPFDARDIAQPRVVQKLLWIDDTLLNNAYESAQLATLGVDVTTATSTVSALAALFGRSTSYDAVISDMGRVEGANFNANAGLDFVREARGRGFEGPIFIYSSGRSVARRREILDAGGTGITASPTDLFALLRSVGPFPSATTPN